MASESQLGLQEVLGPGETQQEFSASIYIFRLESHYRFLVYIYSLTTQELYHIYTERETENKRKQKPLMAFHRKHDLAFSRTKVTRDAENKPATLK
jgi:hypothetical protein